MNQGVGGDDETNEKNKRETGRTDTSTGTAADSSRQQKPGWLLTTRGTAL